MLFRKNRPHKMIYAFLHNGEKGIFRAIAIILKFNGADPIFVPQNPFTFLFSKHVQVL